jgi:hypothetical protein
MMRLLVRLVMVLVEGAMGLLALTSSSIFSDFAGNLSRIFSFHVEYSVSIISCVVIGLGILLIMLPKNPKTGFFTLIIILMCIPSLMPFSAVDWANVLGWSPLEARISFSGMVAVIITAAICHIVIVFSSSHAEFVKWLLESVYDKTTIKQVSLLTLTWGLGLLGAIIIGAVIIMVLSQLIGIILKVKSEYLSLGTVIIGIIGIVLTIGVVYELIMRKREDVYDQ